MNVTTKGMFKTEDLEYILKMQQAFNISFTES